MMGRSHSMYQGSCHAQKVRKWQSHSKDPYKEAQISHPGTHSQLGPLVPFNTPDGVLPGPGTVLLRSETAVPVE